VAVEKIALEEVDASEEQSGNDKKVEPESKKAKTKKTPKSK